MFTQFSFFKHICTLSFFVGMEVIKNIPRLYVPDNTSLENTVPNNLKPVQFYNNNDGNKGFLKVPPVSIAAKATFFFPLKKHSKN